MDWVKQHYDAQSRIFGRAVITAQHRHVAERLGGWCREHGPVARVLELGAGACGVAAAMAQAGYEVTAVEFNPSDVALARRLAEAEAIEGLSIVDGDFYEVELEGRFDLVYYWDGFGVGDDSDQRRLLARIGSEWLAEDGLAMIDVFSPWNWQQRHGERATLEAADGSSWQREIRFDAVRGRFRDLLWPAGAAPDDAEALSQSIRLYTLQELSMLVEGTGLRVDAFLGVDGLPIDPTVEDGALSERLMSTNGYFVRLVRG